MGIKNLLRKIISKEKKIVICGLDNAGKTTMVSFLQTGTFIEHGPTMGKEVTSIDLEGTKIKLVDMGGQKDFRSLWIGEMKDASFVIYMVDAADKDRLNEAKKELWRLSSLIEEIPLIVLANKYDLSNVASIKELIETLELYEFDSFEIIPISCKTGFGVVKAFKKIYRKLTGKNLKNKLKTRALTIFDKGGVPLTSTSSDDILKGGLFSAITNFIEKSFNSELSRLELGGHTILFKRSNHFMGSIVVDESENASLTEAEDGLDELLCHLENMCPEAQKETYDEEKVKFLVEQYSTNLID